MRKVVIAPDSFKGSLSSLEVAHAVATGVRVVFPECETVCLETADGGEGTASALTKALKGLNEKSGLFCVFCITGTKHAERALWRSSRSLL